MTGTNVQAKAFRVGSVQYRTVIQLLFCHCFILLIAILSGSQTLFILLACAGSFLLLLNIPYNLYVLEITLDRLAHGFPIEPVSLRLRWPLTRLFILINMLEQQAGQQVQLERRNVAYRDQLLQQAGKAAAQEERNRLARDLHDSIKQQIFSIVVSAAAIKARWEDNLASTRKIVDDIERTALEAQVEMQALLQQLRPTALENVGLIESLRMQCQALGYRTGAEVTAELGDLPSDELLPIGTQETIFRIVQEGFANIARHARASHIWLSLRRQRDVLLIEIGDDGQGFDLVQANEHAHSYERYDRYDGMGLSNVRERVSTLGGTVAIWSLPNRGTTLHLCIPLINPRSEVQEQERQNQVLVASLSRAHRVLRIGELAAEVAVALMLLYVPYVPASIAQWAVLACIIVALACWLWVQPYGLQAVTGIGRKHMRYFAFLAESYALLSGTLLLCLLYPNYFEGFRNAAYSPILSDTLWLIVGFFGVFIVAIIVTYMRSLQNTERYYRLLSRQVLHKQLHRQLQQIVIDWIAWFLVVGLTIFMLNVFPTFVSDMGDTGDTGVQWIGLVLIAAWFFTLLLKSLRIAHWHNTLRLLTKRASADEKRGIV